MKLLKLEWMKLKGHIFFWIGLGIYVLGMILLIVGFGDFQLFGSNQKGSEQAQDALIKIQTFGDAGFYKLPYLWQNVTYLAGFFKFIPTFLLIFFVSNEFQYKTYRQNIIDGLSTNQFFWSKIISTVLFSVGSLLVISLTGFIIALSYNPDASLADYFVNMDYLLAFFAEVLFIITFALFLTLLFRRSTVAIIVIISYYFIVEPVLSFLIKEPLSNYLPTQPSRELILQPFTRLFKVDSFLGIESPDQVSYKFLILTFAYCIAFAYGGYLVLKRRDA
jgi:hypothetical protein